MSPATRFLATFMAATAASLVQAGPMPSARPTAIEMTSLPDYCKARFGTDAKLREAYAQRLGRKQFEHIHHHCMGLNLLNRASVTTNTTDRRYFLQDAVQQFNYVLTRWPKDYVLTPEAEKGKATATMLLGSIPSSRR